MIEKPQYHLKSKITKNFVKLCVISFFLLFVNDSLSQTITWQKVLNNNYGGLYKTQQTTDGGYVAVGTDRINNEPKIYFTKLNYLGNVLWTKIYGVGNTGAFWVDKTNDNGFIIGGSIDSGLVDDKIYLIKTDSLGNLQWHRTFANSDLDQCYCVKQTPDGGYILSCRTTPFSNSIVMFIKTDSTGNLVWQKVYGNSNVSISIQELGVCNYSYIAAGRIFTTGPASIYVMKLNLFGDTVWTRKYGGTVGSSSNSIDIVNNEGFIIGGSSNSFNVNNKIESYVCKIDTNGNLLWQKTYSNLGRESCYSIRYKAGRGYILAGGADSLNNSNFRGKLRLIDLNGSLLYENSFLGSNSGTTLFTIENTVDGGFITAGLTTLIGAYEKMYVAKIDSLLQSNPIGIINIISHHPAEFKLYQNYPNPFNPMTRIRFSLTNTSGVKLNVFDINGKEIVTLVETNLKYGVYETVFDAGELASGIYFYKLSTDYYSETKKMIILK